MMTREEWFSASDQHDVMDMLQMVTLSGHDRPGRLWAAAVVRAGWKSLFDEGKSAVVAAEFFADGKVDANRLEEMRGRVERLRGNWNRNDVRDGRKQEKLRRDGTVYSMHYAAELLCHKPADFSPAMVCWTATSITGLSNVSLGSEEYVARTLRDVIGDPFWKSEKGSPAMRPGWIPGPAWEGRTWGGWTLPEPLSDESLEVARGIYLTGRFDETPRLADLLDRKGEAPEHFVRHLREPLHVKGCWVLDLLLGLGMFPAPPGMAPWLG